MGAALAKMFDIMAAFTCIAILFLAGYVVGREFEREDDRDGKGGGPMRPV